MPFPSISNFPVWDSSEPFPCISDLKTIETFFVIFNDSGFPKCGECAPSARIYRLYRENVNQHQYPQIDRIRKDKFIYIQRVFISREYLVF